MSSLEAIRDEFCGMEIGRTKEMVDSGSEELSGRGLLNEREGWVGRVKELEK